MTSGARASTILMTVLLKPTIPISFDLDQGLDFCDLSFSPETVLSLTEKCLVM